MTDFDSIAAEFGDDPGGSASIEHEAAIWLWKSARGDAPAAWHFLTLDGDAASTIRRSSAIRTGFGSIKVTARIGSSEWKTSIFPSNESGGYLLPVKASVRKKEGISERSIVRVRLEI